METVGGMSSLFQRHVHGWFLLFLMGNGIYLVGGLGQGKKVYHTSVESLVTIHIEDAHPKFMVAGTPEGGEAVLTSVWKDELLDAPLEYSADLPSSN